MAGAPSLPLFGDDSLLVADSSSPGSCGRLSGRVGRDTRRRQRRRIVGGTTPTLCALAAAAPALLAAVLWTRCAASTAFTPAGREGQARARSAVSRQAAFDKKRLEKEAMFTADLWQSFVNWINPRPQQSEAELAAAERRYQAVLAAEADLQTLRLSVVAETDEGGARTRRSAPISVLQSQAKQGIAIFAAVRAEVLQDVLLAYRLAARDFADRNVLLVPALVSLETRSLEDLPDKMRAAKVFNEGVVALPSPSSFEDRATWGRILVSEYNEAEAQGAGEQALSAGWSLLLRKDGTLVRRGVGRPDWQAVFEDLGV